MSIQFKMPYSALIKFVLQHRQLKMCISVYEMRQLMFESQISYYRSRFQFALIPCRSTIASVQNSPKRCTHRFSWFSISPFNLIIVDAAVVPPLPLREVVVGAGSDFFFPNQFMIYLFFYLQCKYCCVMFFCFLMMECWWGRMLKSYFNSSLAWTIIFQPREGGLALMRERWWGGRLLWYQILMRVYSFICERN